MKVCRSDGIHFPLNELFNINDTMLTIVMGKLGIPKPKLAIPI